MAVTLGYKGKLQVSFDAGVTYEDFAKVTEGAYKGEGKKIDITSWDDEGNENTLPGIKSRTLSITGYWDLEDSVHTRYQGCYESGRDIYIKYYSNRNLGKWIEARASINSVEITNPLDKGIEIKTEVSFKGRVSRVTA